MPNVLFENEHKPNGSFPYISLSNENLSFISHYHEEIEIAYVERGATTVFSGSNEIALKQNDICIFMPGEIHSFDALTSSNVYIIKINAGAHEEQINFEKIRLISNRISPADENYHIFHVIIMEMIEEYKNKLPGYEFVIRSCKNRFISSIIRYAKHIYVNENRNINMLNKVNNYIEQRYSNKITLEEIAEVCLLSKYYFAHIFKSMTGMSFVSYLSLFRIEKAVILFKYSNKSITEVALECGFGNVRSFNRIFKEVFNTTPLHYKKSNTALKEKQP